MTIDRTSIADGLRNVLDSELGINIVDLGLVYQIWIDNRNITVELAMTSPACPMSNYIALQAERILNRQIEELRVSVNIVDTPPWSPMMVEPSIRNLFS